MGCPGGDGLWIVGEVAPIRGFHALQWSNLVTGVLVVDWTPSGREQVIRS